MDDLNTAVAKRKYGIDFGHEFKDQYCIHCNITYSEYSRKSGIVGKKVGAGILCDKVLNEIKNNKPKKRLQLGISENEFWNYLVQFHKGELLKNRQAVFHSFKETYQWFWSNKKVNRSTFAKLFGEIYNKADWTGKNRLNLHGSPIGAYKDKDRLPITINQNYREMSLWSFTNFDQDDCSIFNIKKDYC
jgi:hypothetical protein